MFFFLRLLCVSCFCFYSWTCSLFLLLFGLLSVCLFTFVLVIHFVRCHVFSILVLCSLFLTLVFVFLEVPCSFLFVYSSSGLPLLLVGVCSCGRVNNPFWWQRICLRAIQRIGATTIGQTIHRFDLLRSVAMDAQPMPPSQGFVGLSNERGPTLHPHHRIAHNPRRRILCIYNKTTIIAHGGFHNPT